MYRKFKSIAHNEFAYAFDTSASDFKAPIEDKFRQFYTYGDGLTAHSEAWSVQLEFLTDYLASLAIAMQNDEELAQAVRYIVWRQPSVRQIEFAASIIYKAPPDGERWTAKTKYFSLKEMKVSSSPSKAYDKRYTAVTENHDGTPMSMYRILVPDYADGLEKFNIASALHAWCVDSDYGRDRPWMEYPALFLGWFKDDPEAHEKARRLRDALDACRAITESYRLRSVTNSHVENYKRNVEGDALRAAQKKEGSAATTSEERSHVG